MVGFPLSQSVLKKLSLGPGKERHILTVTNYYLFLVLLTHIRVDLTWEDFMRHLLLLLLLLDVMAARSLSFAGFVSSFMMLEFL